jgi:hypothetical protein
LLVEHRLECAPNPIDKHWVILPHLALDSPNSAHAPQQIRFLQWDRVLANPGHLLREAVEQITFVSGPRHADQLANVWHWVRASLPTVQHAVVHARRIAINEDCFGQCFDRKASQQ